MANSISLRNTKAASLLAAAALAIGASNASAAISTPGESLNDCQAVVAKQAAKYTRSVSRTIGKCLAAITAANLEGGATPSDAALDSARTCTKSLRKLLNSEDPTKQLSTRFEASLDKACDPGVNAKLTHADADTWSGGAAQLDAANLGAWCSSGGGDGAIGSYAEWRDCVSRTAECRAQQLVANQWPRALGFFENLKSVLSGLPASASRDDSLAALDALDRAIEGTVDDNLPDLTCGQWSSALAVTGQTLCDQGDGTLGSCTTAAHDEDGKLAKGLPRRFVDNGDGTVSDLVTGLMWEKLSDDESINDTDRCYPSNRLDLKPEFRLNWNRYAGYSDWRLPTRDELESLVDAGRSSPAIDPVFHHDCTPGCSAVDCACTNGAYFWTSTPDTQDPTFTSQWVVNFGDGSVFPIGIWSNGHVRGVRGGRIDPIPVGNEPPVPQDRSVRNPWRSACVPIQFRVSDPDSRSVGLRIATLPDHGFLTQFVAGGCGADLPEDWPASDQFSWYNMSDNDGREIDTFLASYCYVPFSPTFTGFDSFTYHAVDSEGHESLVPGTVSIEIFEVN